MTRFFLHKAWLRGLGLGVGLVGIALAWRWLVWTAVALLGLAFLLRFGERPPRPGS